VDDLQNSDDAEAAPRFCSLPMSQVFIVLSVILLIPFVLSLFLSSDPLNVVSAFLGLLGYLVMMALVPPFVGLFWAGSGLAAFVQWMRLRRGWMDREKGDA
jgi:hypothetical protein